MHPTATFDLIQADHRERIETARLLSRHAARRAAVRPDGETRGRPPERFRQPRLRALLPATTTVAAIR
ncbi:hypothetical protein MHY85_11790 [Cellulomonas sp. ACRRI]|uniref:hypothetical protein n=1 Tax=Cellulomonas sp. ACRRI TaxID=2918188 RepID=UPI001EF3A8E2|nr:hypothetical protein [Cellulomonas sp. ACRRI]MCG7286650.1 hypothetical protein [Cellulomonas sp. ACRRI]